MSPPVLGYPDRNKPMRVILDASSTGLGYILININEDESETPLYYGGRSTTRAEPNYSATHLGLAALFAALKAFHSYLVNNEFEIVTDHISLTYLKNLRAGPSKLARASVQLSQFKFKVNHLAGRKNSAADALSRTEGLATDLLTTESETRHDEDSRLDFQLTGENPEEVTACDIAIQCELTTDKATETETPACCMSECHRNQCRKL